MHPPRRQFSSVNVTLVFWSSETNTVILAIEGTVYFKPGTDSCEFLFGEMKFEM